MSKFIKKVSKTVGLAPPGAKNMSPQNLKSLSIIMPNRPSKP